MAKDTEGTVEDSKSKIGLVFAGLAAAALLLFVFQNTEDAAINFLWFDGTMPIFLLIFITIALTVVLSVITAWLLNRRSKN
ncbi:MAG: LapA family protein [Acidimicrobiia bacterium]|nr:LapA family protein [Acidimicrobiia bacterium]